MIEKDMNAKKKSGRNPASNGLLEQLREDILLGKYGRGEKIGELQLAQKYGTSRTVVRGVLSLLEREGLIQTLANGTRRIVGLQERDITNLYEMRIYLEQTAVKQLTLDSGDFSPVLQAVQCVAAASNEDAIDLLRIDMVFHRSVIEASGNNALLQSWDAISGVIHALCRFNLMESTEYRQWYAETFKERHMGLFMAIMRDKNEAMLNFAGHIEEAEAISRRAFVKFHVSEE